MLLSTIYNITLHQEQAVRMCIICVEFEMSRLTIKEARRNLSEMADILGQRQACIARELTKLHEETINGDLRELANRVASMPPLKGEVVLVVAGRAGDVNSVDDAILAGLLRAEMDNQRLRDAVANVVSATGISKNRVYRIALAVANDSAGTED